MAFAAHQLLAALHRGPSHATASRHAHGLTATSIDLLHWWCATGVARARRENFNAAQREALLQLVLMHESPGAAAPGDESGAATHPLRGRVRLVPGAGLRWLAQALLVWQWANHATARGLDRRDPRFDDRIVVGADGHDDDALLQRLCDSILRHARLFLPPLMRVPFQLWVASRAGHGNATVDRASSGPVGALRLRNAAGLDIVIDDRTEDDRIDGRARALYALSPARAMRLGVVKLPMFEPSIAAGSAPLRPPPIRRAGARPRLRRSDAALLARGLACLAERETAFLALDPARAPRMRVICDTPNQARAACAWLRAHGIAPAAMRLASAPGLGAADDVRIVVEVDAPSVRADARTCVLVRLRTHLPSDPDRACRMLCAPLLWPEPEYAPLRAASRERAVAGGTPTDLIDVLSVIDHPRLQSQGQALSAWGSAARRRDTRPIAATGDLMRVELRADAAAFDLIVPPPCIDLAPFDPGERLSDVETQRVRRSASLACRKSIYPRLGWDPQDGGLRRALVEMAESDALIELHCLLDPRQHADRHRDLLLALDCDARGLIHAVAATRHDVYLIELQPSGALAPRASTPAERALRRWCGHVNASPPEARSHRRWRWVRLPAPLFWSRKRAGTDLSALLAALGETRPLLPRAVRAQSQPCS